MTNIFIFANDAIFALWRANFLHKTCFFGYNGQSTFDRISMIFWRNFYLFIFQFGLFPFHSVEIRNFLCHDIFYKIFEKFREINLVSVEYSKMVLEITQLQSFGANLRKSCPNIPNSRRFEDFKSVKKPGIHWTLT